MRSSLAGAGLRSGADLPASAERRDVDRPCPLADASGRRRPRHPRDSLIRQRFATARLCRSHYKPIVDEWDYALARIACEGEFLLRRSLGTTDGHRWSTSTKCKGPWIQGCPERTIRPSRGDPSTGADGVAPWPVMSVHGRPLNTHDEACELDTRYSPAVKPTDISMCRRMFMHDCLEAESKGQFFNEEPLSALSIRRASRSVAVRPDTTVPPPVLRTIGSDARCLTTRHGGA